MQCFLISIIILKPKDRLKSNYIYSHLEALVNTHHHNIRPPILVKFNNKRRERIPVCSKPHDCQHCKSVCETGGVDWFNWASRDMARDIVWHCAHDNTWHPVTCHLMSIAMSRDAQLNQSTPPVSHIVVCTMWHDVTCHVSWFPIESINITRLTHRLAVLVAASSDIVQVTSRDMTRDVTWHVFYDIAVC